MIILVFGLRTDTVGFLGSFRVICLFTCLSQKLALLFFFFFIGLSESIIDDRM